MQYKVLADDVNKQANTVDYHVLVAGAAQARRRRRAPQVSLPPPHDARRAAAGRRRRLRLQRRGAVQDAAALADRQRHPEAGRRRPRVRQQGAARVLAADRSGAAARRQGLEAREEDRARRRQQDADHHACRTPSRARIAGPSKLSFNQAMVIFTDTAKELFEKVPELRAMTFVGRWKDQDVVKISHGPHAVSGDQHRRHRGADRPAARPRLPRAVDGPRHRRARSPRATRSAWPRSTRRCSGSSKGMPGSLRR